MDNGDYLGNHNSDKFRLFMRESCYFFQRILAIAILSVCPSVRHVGESVKNGAS